MLQLLVKRNIAEKNQVKRDQLQLEFFTLAVNAKCYRTNWYRLSDSYYNCMGREFYPPACFIGESLKQNECSPKMFIQNSSIKGKAARIFIPKYNEKSETSECVRTEDEAWEIEEDG